MAASIATMGAILGFAVWLTGLASFFEAIVLTALLALFFGWLLFPLSTLLGIGLFAVVGHRLLAAETPPRRRVWVLSGAGIGVLVALAMIGESVGGGAGNRSTLPLLAALIGSAALTGVIGLALWREIVVPFDHSDRLTEAETASAK